MGRAEPEGAAPAVDNLALLDVTSLARRLRVAPSTVYSWVSNRRIPFVKLGGRTLFDPEAIARWLLEHARPVRPVGERLGRERRRRRARREATVTAANHTGKERTP